MNRLLALITGLLCIFLTNKIYLSVAQWQFVIAFAGGALTNIIVSVVLHWQEY